jgi:quinol monooxygenase YgiN
MTYAHVVEVAAPIEMYDALHEELSRQDGGEVDGLLVHVARATATGFQVVEVWESKSHFQRYNQDAVLPTAARLGAGQQGPPLEQRLEEFDVRGLVLTGAKVTA